jgi:hypothetical protein
MGINIVMEPIKRSQCNVCPSFIDVVKKCWIVYRFKYNGKSSVRGCGRAFTSTRERILFDYLTPSHTGFTAVGDADLRKSERPRTRLVKEYFIPDQLFNSFCGT